jgi:hypothetical protein
MDRPVTTAPLPRTTALVRQVRNRLWLKAGIGTLIHGLWLAAGLLLLGGLTHRFALPLPRGMLLALALLPPAAALAGALIWHRPPAAAAARKADRWFDGHNLITSAWELHRRSGLTPTAALILARAETASTGWRNRLARERALHWPRHGTLALLLAATGLFLLQLPSQGWLATGPLAAPPESGPRAMTGFPTLRRLEEPAAAAFPHLAQRPETGTEAEPGAEPVAAPSPAMSAPTDAVPETPPAALPAPSRSLQVQANDGGSRAGDQAGRRLDPGWREGVPLRVAEQAIVRRGGHAGSGDGRGTETAAAGITAPLPVVSEVAAAQRAEQQPYRADLRPALRQYIARYFQELRTAP